MKGEIGRRQNRYLKIFVCSKTKILLKQKLVDIVLLLSLSPIKILNFMKKSVLLFQVPLIEGKGVKRKEELKNTSSQHQHFVLIVENKEDYHFVTIENSTKENVT